MTQQQEDLIRKLLKQTEETPIDDSVKSQSIQSAITAFEQSHQKSTFSLQGFLDRLRLMMEPQNGSKPVKQFKRKWVYSGLAAASVAAFSVLVIHQSGGLHVDPVPAILPEEREILSPPLAASDLSNDQSDSESESEQRQSKEVRPQPKNHQAIDGVTDAPMTTASKAPPLTIAKPGSEGFAQSADKAIPADTLADGTNRPPASVPVLERSLVGAGDLVSKQLRKKDMSQHSPRPLIAAHPSPDQDIIILPPNIQNRDQFKTFEQSPIKQVSVEPISTFSIDVDTASYSFVRRQLNQGVLPQKAAVRLEEMVNYFDYNYPMPESRKIPFNTTVSVIDSPWKAGSQLVHIGIKGYKIDPSAQPKTNLVFLLDVSGSMNSADKLPLVKQSMGLLLSQLKPDDTVAIAVYAGAAGRVLEPTPAKDKQTILNALNRLNAGGSTAGAQGIKLAYQLAQANFDKNAVNRIILATDGDFNVGITNREELKGYVERQRDKGIFLSVLGFGQGNYNDHLMQQLAQNGNGVAAYIDTLSEAQKVLVNEATSTLFPIAKDVKIQVEFNPATISEYRLLGYETRSLKQEDFNNDKVDAGDIVQAIP